MTTSVSNLFPKHSVVSIAALTFLTINLHRENATGKTSCDKEVENNNEMFHEFCPKSQVYQPKVRRNALYQDHFLPPYFHGLLLLLQE